MPVWGWARTGEHVTLSLENPGTRARAQVEATADATGRWTVNLPAQDAGGPYSLHVRTASGLEQAIRDVLVGDVWLCSGQSNMQLQVRRTLNTRVEIENAANDSIRMLTVEMQSSLDPRRTLANPTEWQVASPATVPDFSATCFYFARELQKTTHVPMGLINASWGGSKIEAWMSEAALRAVGGYDRKLDILNTYKHDPAGANVQWGELWEQWWLQQTGATAKQAPWSARPGVERTWRTAPAQLGYWETWGVPELANYDGLLWYRTTVRLTARQAKLRTLLSLGKIDEIDETWVNGHAVGYTSGPGTERLYELPAGLLHAGENTIAIAALDTYGFGGINGPAAQRALKFADGESVPLDGKWRYSLPPSNIGAVPRAPWESVGGLTTIHNAMIAPLVPYAIRGALWYQGESNTDAPENYQALLSGLMADWRATFGAELPFLIVQLANYGPAATAPGNSNWAQLREAQRQAVARDTHAALAVAIDIGERADIHPANKQELGRRLARAALHVVYGDAIAPSGPVPASAQRDGNRVVVSFGDVDGHLQVYGAKRPVGFELCGTAADSCRFVDAVAEGDRVWLQPEGPEPPTRVRFEWADSPVCNLYDHSGLPAGPFELPIE